MSMHYLDLHLSHTEMKMYAEPLLFCSTWLTLPGIVYPPGTYLESTVIVNFLFSLSNFFSLPCWSLPKWDQSPAFISLVTELMPHAQCRDQWVNGKWKEIVHLPFSILSISPCSFVHEKQDTVLSRNPLDATVILPIYEKQPKFSSQVSREERRKTQK